ncbi:MAG: hypothetical protein JNK45_26625, partial [Myxococcales bacterium]|nr:hypothetical protein [Myxococcales bacterium]
VLFYRLLAGVTPFDGCEDATIFYKTINDRPRDLHDLLPDGHDVPDALIGLIHDCLAKDVADRPADANIVVERLIDAVPANYFRLPSLTPTGQTAVAAVPRSVVGNTGLIQLLDRSAPRPAANVAPTPMAIPTPARTRARVAGWAGVVAVACLVSAATAWGLGAGRDPAPGEASVDRAVTQAGLAPAPTGAPTSPPVAPPSLDAAAPAPTPVAIATPASPPIPAPVAAAVPVAIDEPASSGRSRRSAARPRPPAPAPAAAAPASPPPVAAPPPPPSEPAPAPERKSVFLSADRPVAGDRSLLPAAPRTP